MIVLFCPPSRIDFSPEPFALVTGCVGRSSHIIWPTLIRRVLSRAFRNPLHLGIAFPNNGFPKTVPQKRLPKQRFPKTFFQKRFPKNGFPKLVSQKRFPKNAFPTTVSQLRFPKNGFCKNGFPETVHKNGFPKTFFTKAISNVMTHHETLCHNRPCHGITYHISHHFGSTNYVHTSLWPVYVDRDARQAM